MVTYMYMYSRRPLGPGTQFTCFPSTKLQILTPEELQRAARAVTPQNFTFQTPKWTRGNESLTLLEPLIGEFTCFTSTKVVYLLQ